MAHIDDYIANPDQALIDAVKDPIFKQFITPSDIDLVVVTQGGVQSQAQALKKSSVGPVIQRALAASKAAGSDLLNLICSPKEFNLCYTLRGALPGVAMTMLNDFLANRIARWATAGVGIFTAFTAGTLAVVAGKFIAILVALGLVHHELLKLCNCPDA